MDQRKVWVVEVPPNNEYGIPACQVMIEQFGDRRPTIAFRPDSGAVWGRPYEGEAR